MKKINYLLISTLTLTTVMAHAQRLPSRIPQSKDIFKNYKIQKKLLDKKEVKEETAKTQNVRANTSSAKERFESYFNNRSKIDYKDLEQQLKDIQNRNVLPAKKESIIEQIAKKYGKEIRGAYVDLQFDHLRYKNFLGRIYPGQLVLIDQTGNATIESEDTTPPVAAIDQHFTPPYSSSNTNIETTLNPWEFIVSPIAAANKNDGSIKTETSTIAIGGTKVSAEVSQLVRIPSHVRRFKVTARINVQNYETKVLALLGIGNVSTGLYINGFDKRKVRCQGRARNYNLAKTIGLIAQMNHQQGQKVVELTVMCTKRRAHTQVLINVGSKSSVILAGGSFGRSTNDSIVESIDVEYYNSRTRN